ncbi:MAG: ribosome-associated translation inhibitor RaiA [Vicinamibacterales bacterium]
MRLDLTGRNVDITPALRQLLGRKLARLERQLQDSAVSTQVVLTRERNRLITDMTLHLREHRVHSGMGAGSAWSESMGEALDKILQQAQRVKGKWADRRRRPKPVPAETDARIETPAREKAAAATKVRYAIRRHTLNGAIARLDAAVEPFVVFRHDATMRVAIVFRRRDGSLGLIEADS